MSRHTLVLSMATCLVFVGCAASSSSSEPSALLLGGISVVPKPGVGESAFPPICGQSLNTGAMWPAIFDLTSDTQSFSPQPGTIEYVRVAKGCDKGGTLAFAPPTAAKSVVVVRSRDGKAVVVKVEFAEFPATMTATEPGGHVNVVQAVNADSNGQENPPSPRAIPLPVNTLPEVPGPGPGQQYRHWSAGDQDETKSQVLVTVAFGGCDGPPLSVHTIETATSVAIGVVGAKPGPNQICTLEAITGVFAVPLRSPLGTRTVVPLS